jgi:hypothetical protein
LAFFTRVSGVSVVQTRIVVPLQSSVGDGEGSIDAAVDGTLDAALDAAADGALLAAGLGEAVPAWHAARNAPTDANAPVVNTWRRLTGVLSSRSTLFSSVMVLLLVGIHAVVLESLARSTLHVALR